MKHQVLIPAVASATLLTAAGGAAVVLATSAPGAAAAPAAATTTTATTATTATTVSAGCDTSPWTAEVLGRPAALDRHSKTGAYFWHGTDGFHLRVTHRGTGEQVFTGSVSATAPIVTVRRLRDEGADRVWRSADGKTLTFRFVDHGEIDGVDFRTACATAVTVDAVQVGGQALPTGEVYLGRLRAHPAAVPFTVTRGA